MWVSDLYRSQCSLVEHATQINSAHQVQYECSRYRLGSSMPDELFYPSKAGRDLLRSRKQFDGYIISLLLALIRLSTLQILVCFDFERKTAGTPPNCRSYTNTKSSFLCIGEWIYIKRRRSCFDRAATFRRGQAGSNALRVHNPGTQTDRKRRDKGRSVHEETFPG